MSTSRLSKANTVLCYFDSALTKVEFTEKFCAALKKYVMHEHPEQSESLETKKVAEQAWQNYLRTYDFFVRDKVDVGHLKNTSFALENLDKIYFGMTHLSPKHFAIHNYFKSHPEACEQLSVQDKNKLQEMLNLPTYIFEGSDNDKTLIDNDNHLTMLVGNTHPHAMFIIQLGVDVNQYTPYCGNTPLLLAVSKGWNHQNPESPESKSSNFYPQKEIIKALIEKKADVNAKHLRNGMTPLHIACLRGDDPELINLLLVNGANINAKDYRGRTPLELMNLSYEDTKKTIRLLTLIPEDLDNENFAFGSRTRLPENISSTATLPLKEERIANQTKIRTMLASTEVKLSQNPFGKFAPSSSMNSNTCGVNGDTSIQNQATDRTLSPA